MSNFLGKIDEDGGGKKRRSGRKGVTLLKRRTHGGDTRLRAGSLCRVREKSLDPFENPNPAAKNRIPSGRNARNATDEKENGVLPQLYTRIKASRETKGTRGGGRSGSLIVGKPEGSPTKKKNRSGTRRRSRGRWVLKNLVQNEFSRERPKGTGKQGSLGSYVMGDVAGGGSQ